MKEGDLGKMPVPAHQPDPSQTLAKKLEDIFASFKKPLTELTPSEREAARGLYSLFCSDVVRYIDETVLTPIEQAGGKNAWRMKSYREEFQGGINSSEAIDFLLPALDPQKQSALYAALLRGFILFDGHNNQDWAHSVCHNFEKYGRTPNQGDFDRPNFSVFELEDKDKGAITDVLGDFAKRSIREGTLLGNGSRILKPYFLFAMRSLRPGELDAPPAFRPSQFSNPQFISLIRGEQHFGETPEEKEVFAVFCESKTSKEFLLACVQKDLPLTAGFYEDLTLKNALYANWVTALGTLRGEILPEILEVYIKKHFALQDQRSTTGEVLENLEKAKMATEVVKGVFVDVEGTLLIGGVLNERLLTQIQEAAGKGIPVTIFTGGDPRAMTAKLRSLGVPDGLLPVMDKRMYQGKVLELLVDDTPASLQGFRVLGAKDPRSFKPILKKYEEMTRKNESEPS